MARRAKTMWVKVDGKWFKAPVTYGRKRAWTRGLGDCGGWDKRPTVDMSRRSEIHVVRPSGTGTNGGPLFGSLPLPKEG